MSKAAELARAEAARAEAQEDGGDHDDDQIVEPTPAPEPEPEQQWPAEPTEEMFAAARELNADHQAQLHAIFGPFLEGFVECEQCGGAGIAPPAPAAPSFNADPNKMTCSVCDGQGQLDTGSKREGYAIENCENCNGKGYVGPGNLSAVEAARQAVESVGGQQPATPAPVGSGAPPAPAAEDPRVAELRALGYAVVPLNG